MTRCRVRKVCVVAGARTEIMATSIAQVREMQGLYGPFSIAERVLQKIWLRRDFAQAGLRLWNGLPLHVRCPGTWNLLGGPDFKEARLEFGERLVTGDVEVHFHSSDWRAHRHAEDHAYDRVVLHVVLFHLDEGERPATYRDGSEIPTLVLLPLLHRGLEEYASDEALERITSRDALEQIAELAAMPRPELLAMLRHQAGLRWTAKVRFARLRLERLGWREAAHHAALEILGYRHNRAPMLAVAAAFPLARWAAEPEVTEAFASQAGHWQQQGARPANQPLFRLRQYQRWVASRPDWTEVLAALAAEFPAPLMADLTSVARKHHDFGRLRERLMSEIAGGAVGGSRWDTLICDGMLPLIAARSGQDLGGLWFHWFPGDMPAEVPSALTRLGVAGVPGAPRCHGWAQGFLGWFLEREARASG
jgi:hypothetical protein